MSKGRNTVYVAAAMHVIGTITVWAYAGSGIFNLTRFGYEGDGIFTGIIGLLLLIIARIRKPNPGSRFSIFAIILGIISCLICIVDLQGMIGLGVIVKPGIGIFLTLIGGLVAVAGGSRQSQRQDSVIEPPPPPSL